MRERAFPPATQSAAETLRAWHPHAPGSNLLGEQGGCGADHFPSSLGSPARFPHGALVDARQGPFETRPDPFRLMCCCCTSWGGARGQEIDYYLEMPGRIAGPNSETYVTYAYFDYHRTSSSSVTVRPWARPCASSSTTPERIQTRSPAWFSQLTSSSADQAAGRRR